ncbi:MAG: oligosaccharide flippase family protein [Ruminiclostridium sp.]|nr:oligosaccharide flippase family protein [Ruminiclostridium sp.]
MILQGLAFFTAPIFSRLLGQSNYGIYSVYSTWVSIIAIVLPLQAHSAFAVAKATFPKERQEEYQSSAISLAVTAYVILSVPVFLISLALGADSFYITAMLAHGLGSCLIAALQYKFIFEYDAFRNFVLTISVSISGILLSLLLVLISEPQDNYKGRIAGISLTYFIAGIFAYFYIFRKGRRFFSREFWRFTLPITVPTIFHLLANILIAQSDRLMIDGMLGSADAGVYSLAVNFTVVISAIYSALNNAWVPFYYDYTKNDDKESIRIHSRNYLELYTIITCGFMLLSGEVYALFGGEAFASGSIYIPALAAGTFFMFLYSFPVNFEFYHKKTGLIAAVTVSAAVCNIILNYFLIGLYGVMGAVIATIISYILQFSFHYISAKYIIGKDFPYSLTSFAPWIVCTAVCCAASYLLDGLWLIRWLVGFALGVYCVIRILKRRSIF